VQPQTGRNRGIPADLQQVEHERGRQPAQQGVPAILSQPPGDGGQLRGAHQAARQPRIRSPPLPPGAAEQPGAQDAPGEQQRHQPEDRPGVQVRPQQARAQPHRQQHDQPQVAIHDDAVQRCAGAGGVLCQLDHAHGVAAEAGGQDDVEEAADEIPQRQLVQRAADAERCQQHLPAHGAHGEP